MAKATKETKTVVDAVTLRLTKAEAMALNSLVGNTVGQPSSVIKYIQPIFYALRDLNLPYVFDLIEGSSTLAPNMLAEFEKTADL